MNKIYLLWKHYWWIPLAIVVGLALLLLGRTSLFTKILDASRKSADAKREAFAKIEKDRKELDARHEKEYNDAIEKLERGFAENSEKLDDKARERARKLVKKYQNDPDGLSREFAKEFGLVLEVKND